MRALFSVRHADALKQKTMAIPSLGIALRRRLRDIVSDFDEEVFVTDNTGWNFRSSVSQEALPYLKTCLGVETFYLPLEEGENRKADPTIADLIMLGRIVNVFDAIEAVSDSVYTERRADFEKTVNQAFNISNSTLRLMDGVVVLLDQVQLADEIVSPAIATLKSAGCMGAVEEFGEAVKALHNGETKRAVEQANKALESTMKHITGIDRAKPGALLSAMVKSGVVPEYASGFLEAFEKLTHAVAAIRNDAPGAGHGQGTAVTEMPPAVAQLMVNLCGSLILFIIERHLEQGNAGS